MSGKKFLHCGARRDISIQKCTAFGDVRANSKTVERLSKIDEQRYPRRIIPNFLSVPASHRFQRPNIASESSGCSSSHNSADMVFRSRAVMSLATRYSISWTLGGNCSTPDPRVSANSSMLPAWYSPAVSGRRILIVFVVYVTILPFSGATYVYRTGGLFGFELSSTYSAYTSAYGS